MQLAGVVDPRLYGSYTLSGRVPRQASTGLLSEQGGSPTPPQARQDLYISCLTCFFRIYSFKPLIPFVPLRLSLSSILPPPLFHPALRPGAQAPPVSHRASTCQPAPAHTDLLFS
jgi:hypothetical protein